jgi:hypothetical protein
LDGRIFWLVGLIGSCKVPFDRAWSSVCTKYQHGLCHSP